MSDRLLDADLQALRRRVDELERQLKELHDIVRLQGRAIALEDQAVTHLRVHLVSRGLAKATDFDLRSPGVSAGEG